MKIIYAKNPIWKDSKHTILDLIVKFEEYKEELPFTASLKDPEKHGRDLFSRAISGEFGSIAEYVPPSINTIANEVKFLRNNKLQIEVDPIVSNPLRWEEMTEEQKTKWKNYRRALLDITNNPDFPWYTQVLEKGIDAVPWPVKPKE
jgi:hypothetical protein